MNKRTERLLQEIREQPNACKCICGAVYYPENWMTKTREQAEKDGILKRCVDCTSDARLMIKIVSTTNSKGE